MAKRDTSKEQAFAATLIKNVFYNAVVVGGGGRGGSSKTVLNKASRDAELLSVVFADYFGELDASFDAGAFFRACCLREAFVGRMAKARAKHDRREVIAAWREAKKLVARRVAGSTS